MSDFTRGYTFDSDERLSPASLNTLVENATVTNVSLAELGASFKSFFYTDTDPGVTYGRVWYDTTSGQEGLKFAYVSACNASIASWLYATPRREAMYWTETAVSLGTPLFVGRPNDTEGQLALHLYDGCGLLKAYRALGSTDATESQHVLVVAMEGRSDAGPVKCAWAGLIPADTYQSNVSLHNPLFIDHHDAAKFRSRADISSSLFADAISYWHLDGASGTTRIDSVGSNHLGDVAATPVPDAAARINTGADFSASTTEKLRAPDTPTLDFAADFTLSCWVNFNTLGTQRVICSKWNNADTGRSFKLAYLAGPDRISGLVTSDGTLGTQTIVSENTLGSPSTGAWYHVVLQYDSTAETLGISVNRNAFTTAAHSGGIFDGVSAFAVGLDESNTNPMDGIVDDVYVTDRLLTSAELDSIYNGGVGIQLEDITGTARLARSSIYGTVLQNRDNSPPLSTPTFLLWGTGPIIQDIDQRSSS